MPWQTTRDPYRIWVSEIMLQQTQVSTVLAYYAPFVAAFPDIAALAGASLDVVLARWSGLGYYRRARMLHAAAGRIMSEHGGTFPHAVDAIARLPGIGRSTAAAIAAFAFGTRGAILDGNVKRVLARHRVVGGYPGSARVEARLWRIAETLLPADDLALASLLPVDDIRAYTQGMMDLGATVCTPRVPACPVCPVAADCRARIENRVHELPAARPTRVVPHRTVQMLLIEHAGEVLLEQRPPVGVWPGLWCLPQIAMDDDPRVACASRACGVIETYENLGPIEHAFTHYRLTIRPVRVVLRERGADARSGGAVWLTRAAAMQVALPAPVRRLLRVDPGLLLVPAPQARPSSRV